MRRVPWIALGGIVGALGGWAFAALLGRGLVALPPCPLKALTGLPCATCGLTRWGLALARSDLRAAWHWHPVASLFAAGFPALAVWDLRRAWRGRPYPELPDSLAARLLAAGLLAGAWILQVARGI